MLTSIQLLGALLALGGLAGLVHCIREGYRIRGAGLSPEAARERLRRLVAVNLASVGTAALGLAMLAAGLML